MPNLIANAAQTAMDWISRVASSLGSHSGSREIFWTLGVISIASLAGRIQFSRIRDRADATLEEKRQARASFRNGLILGTFGMLGFVWGGEIRALILSLAAIAAAIMIVSKEIISCFYGAFVFALTKPARIGDSVEVGSHKGELMDHNWFCLTLMEHADTHWYSGKSIKVPMSALLSTPIANLSQGGSYRFCTLTMHARQEHASIALECSLNAANTVCSGWVEDAKAQALSLQNFHLTQAPEAEPKASLVSVDKDSLAVSLRFPAPAGKRAATCAEVSKRYFLEFENRLKLEKDKERALANDAAAKIAALHAGAKA